MEELKQELTSRISLEQSGQFVYRRKLDAPGDNLVAEVLTIVHNGLIIFGTMQVERLFNIAYSNNNGTSQRKGKGTAEQERLDIGGSGTEIGVCVSIVQHWEKRPIKLSRLARREMRRLFVEAGINHE